MAVHQIHITVDDITGQVSVAAPTLAAYQVIGALAQMTAALTGDIVAAKLAGNKRITTPPNGFDPR